MDLTELSLYYCHNLLGLLGRRVWCHRWAMSSALLRLGAPVVGEEAVRRLVLAAPGYATHPLGVCLFI